MKNKIKNIVLGMLALSVFSCQDQTEIYEGFVNEFSDKNYPGKVLYPVSYAGKNRVKIGVLTPKDPSSKEMRVFWNFYTDSISVPITATNALKELIIDNLDEKAYSFILKTYDDEGNISVPVEVFGTAYGANYQKLISNRELKSSSVDGITGALTLTFGDADISNGAVETRIRYTDTSDGESTAVLPAADKTITISDYKSGAEYATYFLPEETCIDTFNTEWDGI
ncbi:DUF4998 domain-containing protein [Wenyingzhuangia sp. chi5]|uniref:DUF4998 domain-containing protein n=1 Tax=Wenyingzhuangia gilva TaxID=3057677 RepID=A0ABT8VMR0_9FLAO|nr:DUF4998 domain-containing protein [Wenyingzhuangia sp. chi5]MDO3693261.1 DUF4998 domain-containing protein [Wenyingzhuangia sp. chi5]